MLRKSRFKSVECKMMTPDHFHEREAEKEAKDYEESGAIVEMIKNKLSELADFSFVIGNFFTHCVTHDGKVVPAEGAVVEFSLEGGILAQWHCVLRSGPIPSGYRGQCTENAKKTHNIPIDDENLDEKIGMFRDQDDSESLGNLLKLLYLNSLDGDPKPIFVLDKETENVKKIIQILYKRVGMPGDPPAIYPVEKLLYYLKIVSRDGKFKSNKGETNCRRELVVGKSGYNLEIVKSSDVKNYSSLTKLFESMKYDLEVPLCGFHQELDNHYHCALANARKRVFVFYEKCCPYFGIKIIKGIHTPGPDTFKNLKIQTSQNENDQRNAAIKNAEIFSDVNILGNHVPNRYGSKNGITVIVDDEEEENNDDKKGDDLKRFEYSGPDENGMMVLEKEFHSQVKVTQSLNDNNDVEIEVCRSQVVEYNYESGSSTDPDTDTEEEKDWKTVIYVNNPVVRRNGGSGSRPSG